MLSHSGRAQAPKRIAEDTRRLYCDLLGANQVPDASHFLRPNYKLIEQIVKNLITETGLLRDVYNASDFESSASAINGAAAAKSADKIKAKRTQFVQKLINYAANNEQPVVGCVAAKVVGGLEPAKCNELLQALAKLAQKRIISHQHRRSSGSASVRQRTFTRASTGGGGQVQQVQSQQIKKSRPSVTTKSGTAAAEASQSRARRVAPGAGDDRRRTSVEAKPPARAEATKIAPRQRRETGVSEPSSDLQVGAAKSIKHGREDDENRELDANQAASDQYRSQSKVPEAQVKKAASAASIKSIPSARSNLRDELKNLHKTMANIVDLSGAIDASLVRTSHLVQ